MSLASDGDALPVGARLGSSDVPWDGASITSARRRCGDPLNDEAGHSIVRVEDVSGSLEGAITLSS